jgi:hypothetical protein
LLGCTQGRRAQVVAGWVIAAALAVYKLHFFIASVLPLLLLPALFFRGPLRPRARAAWAVGAVALCAAIVILLRRVPGVPTIRFDGSGVRQIFTLMKSFAPRGALRDALERCLGEDHSLASNLIAGVPYVLLSALGAFALLAPILALALRKRTFAALVCWPLLLIVNFLAMFLGLALDLRSSTPDELSHRPVMIVMFVVVAWVGGAAGLLLCESRRRGRVARPVLVGLALSLLVVPGLLGSGVQRMWAMRMFSPVRVPIGLVRAAEYVRDHAGSHDVLQDSQFDRTCAVAALGEHSPYAARPLTVMPYNDDLLQQRIAFIESFMDLHDAGAVTAAAQQIGLRWFLLDPGDQVHWPAEIVQQPAFQLGGYRLYRF